MKLITLPLVLLFFLLGSPIIAQNIDLSLKFNPLSKEYEVFAIPNFTKDSFLIGAGSQITLLVPAGIADEKIKTIPQNAGEWLDDQPIFAPDTFSDRDFHTFHTEGSIINFQKNEAQLLFSFYLPLSHDAKEVRLFANGKDPLLKNKTEKSIGHFLGNDLTITDFYRKNINIKKTIRGTLKDWKGRAVPQAEISVGDRKVKSNEKGGFELVNVLVEDQTLFEITKEVVGNAGVTAADLILLERHLSGQKTFDKAFQWLAADLDNSGTITQADALLLKQILKGEKKALTWRFLPANYLLDKQLYQNKLPEKIKIWEAERAFSTEFVAIKLGDINGSYTEKSSLFSDIELSAKFLTFNVLNAYLLAGDTYTIPVFLDNYDALAAFQFSLQMEHGKIDGVKKTFAKANSLNVNKDKKGNITVRWLKEDIGKKILVAESSKQMQHQQGKAVFNLEITPNKNGLLSDFITLLNEPIPADAYDLDGQKMLLQLLFQKAPTEEGMMQLYQNNPNPFREKTEIKYFLPSDSPVVLSLLDAKGNLLKTYNEKGKAGFNVFKLKGEEVPTGINHYQLESSFGVEKKKMLRIN